MVGSREWRDGSVFDPEQVNYCLTTHWTGDFLSCQKGVKSGISPTIPASFYPNFANQYNNSDMLDTIESAIEDIKKGKLVIVVDDEDRAISSQLREMSPRRLSTL